MKTLNRVIMDEAKSNQSPITGTYEVRIKGFGPISQTYPESGAMSIANLFSAFVNIMKECGHSVEVISAEMGKGYDFRSLIENPDHNEEYKAAKQ